MNRLRYFCMIAQTGSMARAAEFLNISPAALSKAMTLLEEEVGLALLRPEGRGVVVTKEGVRLAEKASSLIDQFEQLPQFIKGEETHREQLRLGSFEVFTTYLMGEILSEFSDPTDLVLRELVPGKIEEALLEKRIDVGLSYAAIPHRDLDHLQMGQAKMSIYAAKDQFTGIPISQLPFVIPVEPLSGSPTKAQGLDGWQPSFGPRLVRYKVQLMESALELVRRGMAVAYLPNFVVDIHNQYVLPKYKLVEVKLSAKEMRTTPVYLVKRKDDIESALMKKVARTVRRYMD